MPPGSPRSAATKPVARRKLLRFYGRNFWGSPVAQPRKIFLSYRREDSSGEAGRLGDRLAMELGRDSIFMDVDGIPLGIDFVKRLTAEVSGCNVLLAVIGPRWLDARDEEGNRRLDDPNDFVRVEIGAALQREIPVIPILLNGTKIPRQDRLPDNLKDLAIRHGLDVRHNSFHSDVGRLVSQLKLLPSTGQQEPVAPQAFVNPFTAFLRSDPAATTPVQRQSPEVDDPLEQRVQDRSQHEVETEKQRTEEDQLQVEADEKDLRDSEGKFRNKAEEKDYPDEEMAPSNSGRRAKFDIKSLSYTTIAVIALVVGIITGWASSALGAGLSTPFAPAEAILAAAVSLFVALFGNRRPASAVNLFFLLCGAFLLLGFAVSLTGLSFSLRNRNLLYMTARPVLIWLLVAYYWGFIREFLKDMQMLALAALLGVMQAWIGGDGALAGEAFVFSTTAVMLTYGVRRQLRDTVATLLRRPL
jgi:TIR domain